MDGWIKLHKKFTKWEWYKKDGNQEKIDETQQKVDSIEV